MIEWHGLGFRRWNDRHPAEADLYSIWIDLDSDLTIS